MTVERARQGDNMARVHDYVRRFGPVTQSQIAEALGLSTDYLRATIRRLVNRGAVTEDRTDARGRTGRRYRVTNGR